MLGISKLPQEDVDWVPVVWEKDIMRDAEFDELVCN